MISHQSISLVNLDNLTAKEIVKTLPSLSHESKIHAIKKLAIIRDSNSISALVQIVVAKRNETDIRSIALLALGSFTNYDYVIHLKNRAIHHIGELAKNIIKLEKKNIMVYDAAKICLYEFEKRRDMLQPYY
ncbi:MAG: hypothetical protein AABX38_07570 [Candidatus Micrarchaeota archaeon]